MLVHFHFVNSVETMSCCQEWTILNTLFTLTLLGLFLYCNFAREDEPIKSLRKEVGDMDKRMEVRETERKMAALESELGSQKKRIHWEYKMMEPLSG